jgi:hypothetical protein
MLTNPTLFMKTLLIFLLSLTAGFAFGQKFSYPSVKQNGRVLKDFVPKGWTILDSAKGDLNKDKLADAAVILQHTDRVKLPKDTNNDAPVKDTVVIQHRILTILFKNPGDGKYYLAEQSNSFIMDNSDPPLNDGPPLMDDPYQGMKIENGILQISFGLSYSMGNWDTTNASYKFRYQQNQFALIGADYYSMHRATQDYSNYSFNFLSGKRLLEKGNEAKGTKKTYWKSLNIKLLKTLQSFTAPFTWEVESDLYL